jgi:hypothetical protein
MFRLMTQAMMVEMVSRILVTLSANPACVEKIVQNIIPMDSPQETTQKQFNEAMRKNVGVRLRFAANAVVAPKMKEERIVKGTSRTV